MRRVLSGAFAALFLACAIPLPAQETLSPPLGTAVPDADVPVQPGVPASPSGIQPTPQIPVPEGKVPSPVAPSELPSRYIPPPLEPPVPEEPGEFAQVEADQVRTTLENGELALTTAVGNVRVRFRDVLVTAQRAQVDYRTDTATFEGNVVLRIGIQEARGGRFALNLRTREWTGLNASTAIEPRFARGWLQAPVFAQADRLQGLGQRQVHAFGAEATTCNLTVPHYEFVSKSISVYPNNKIILRRVTLYALGRKIFTIPRLVVPLRQIQRNPNVIPRVGQSKEEGFFLKTAYSYLGTQTQVGSLLLDLMSEKGIGKGLQHSWRFANAFGEARLYQIFDRTIDRNTLTGRLTHTQLLGSVRANISTDFRSNSYLYAPDSKTLVNSLTLSRDKPGAATSFAITQSVNNAFVRTSNLTAYMRHRQLFGQDASLDTGLDYTAFTSTGTQARLTSQMLFSKREDKFDWSISAQKLNDLSDEAFAGQGIFAGIEKLPEIGIVTDTTRVRGLLPFDIPARLRITNGQYVELPSNTSLNRTFFELFTPIKRRDLTDTWSLALGAGFRQYFYSDGTAQYSIDANTELSKRLGPTSSFDLTYRYQMPRGFTPFRFDFVGRYNIATAGINYQDNSKVRFSLLTGYNFEQPQFPWQDVTLRFSFQPTNSLLFYTATGYDINRSQWRTLINQLRVRAGDRFRLDVGTRYDTIRKEIAAGRLVLDTAIDRLTRLQAVASYNGFTRNFDYSGVMLTRDLHCWEASLIYTRQTGFFESQGIMLNLRIKAFPLFSDFGVGAFGQALDTSVGQVY